MRPCCSREPPENVTISSSHTSRMSIQCRRTRQQIGGNLPQLPVSTIHDQFLLVRLARQPLPSQLHRFGPAWVPISTRRLENCLRPTHSHLVAVYASPVWPPPLRPLNRCCSPSACVRTPSSSSSRGGVQHHGTSLRNHVQRAANQQGKKTRFYLCHWLLVTRITARRPMVL